MKGNFRLTKGHVLKIIVGQEGGVNTVSGGSGGGGGTFVFNQNTKKPLLVGMLHDIDVFVTFNTISHGLFGGSWLWSGGGGGGGQEVPAARCMELLERAQWNLENVQLLNHSKLNHHRWSSFDVTNPQIGQFWRPKFLWHQKGLILLKTRTTALLFLW